jgi:hypothetical protein
VADPPRETRPRTQRRADFGAPIEEFLEKQPLFARLIVEELRALIHLAAPEARSSLKWGMPFFSLNGTTFCAITAHKAHVNLVLYGPRDAYDDPDGLLGGTGKAGYHYRVTSLDALPRDRVLDWLRTAAGLAAERGRGGRS